MIHAVIGAQFGDEGKGLLVDYLSDNMTLVVRFNGGAQAGHTVVLSDGRRHVFGHLGAGCYKAACTLLSRYFIVNPILYVREFNAPELQGIRRTTYVDDRCLVTTPVDMLLNQAVEAKRGDGRHGSCGVGINETVTRSEHDEFRLTVGDLRLPCDSLLRRINYAWAPQRAALLGVVLPPPMRLEAIMARWQSDAQAFLTTTMSAIDTSAIAASDDVVFEGAQGLRLDEQAPFFPHVTRSRTGLTNVISLLAEAQREAEPLHVHYVTRAYVTRHGAGPLPGEVEGHPFGWVGPETNVENEHQGALRYGHLRLSELEHAIMEDYRPRQQSGRQVLRAGLAVTCLDQVLPSLGTLDSRAGEAQLIAENVGLPLHYWSDGPTMHDVHKVKETR